MQDGAAEINLNEDLVLSRRWRQLKVIVLKKNKRRRRPPLPGSAPAPRAAPDGQLLLTGRQDYPSTAIYSGQFRTIYK